LRDRRMTALSTTAEGVPSYSQPFDLARRLSDLKNRSENSAGRGQILPVLQVNSHSIDLQNRQNMDRTDGFAADFL